jgi:hypothetical protein
LCCTSMFSIHIFYKGFLCVVVCFLTWYPLGFLRFKIYITVCGLGHWLQSGV